MNVRHPFEWLSESVQKISFVVILVFTLACMIIMQLIGHPLVNETALQGIVSFEFAGTFDSAHRILASWGAQGQISAGLSLGFDYLFLVVYAIWIALGCVLVARAMQYRVTILKPIGFILAWAQFLAALLDAIENYALIRVLIGSTEDLWPALARTCAGPKFLIISAGLLYILLGLIFIFSIKSKRLDHKSN